MPLAVIPPTHYSYNHNLNLYQPTRQHDMDRSLFGSIKSKWTRKNTNEKRKNSIESRNMASTPTPFSSSAPATRRPDRPGMNAFTTPINEPPPAYTPAPEPVQAPVSSSSTNFPTTSTADDRYAFLSSFDTVFLIDDSGSMAGRSWRETAAALETITPICTAHDSDGIDIYFLNARDSPHFKNVTSVSTVREIFSTVRPQAGTPTGQRLNRILKPYLQRYTANPDGTKPLNIIVITDGEPSDDVESPIIAAAKKLDRLDAPAWQVGIQFFQVGREPGAREHLKQLDDDLAEIAGDDELRDMVDTVPFLGDNEAELTADGVMKVVLGSVNRRLDRKRSKDLHRRV